MGTDGTRIVTASRDDTAKVWDSDGTFLATLQGHDDAVGSAVFSPDGTRIVTASFDATAKVWETWTFEDAFEEIQERLGALEFTTAECAQFRINPCPADS